MPDREVPAQPDAQSERPSSSTRHQVSGYDKVIRTHTADRPARVGAVRLQITVPGGVPPQRTDALLAVASHCTVHNTLRQPPEVSIELARTR